MTEQERFEAWFSTRPDFKVWAGMFGNPFSRKADGSYELSVVSTAFDSWKAAQQKEGYVPATSVREAVIAGWELSAEGHNNEYCTSNQSELNRMFDQAVEDVLKAAQEPT